MWRCLLSCFLLFSKNLNFKISDVCERSLSNSLGRTIQVRRIDNFSFLFCLLYLFYLYKCFNHTCFLFNSFDCGMHVINMTFNLIHGKPIMDIDQDSLKNFRVRLANDYFSYYKWKKFHNYKSDEDED